MSGLAKVLSLLTHVLAWVNVFCVKIIAPSMEYFNIMHGSNLYGCWQLGKTNL